MILQLIFTINHGKASMERGFNLNKLPLAQNVEELIIRSQRLIKDHLLSHKLSPHSKDISSRMLSAPNTGVKTNYNTSEIRNNKMKKINRKVLLNPR